MTLEAGTETTPDPVSIPRGSSGSLEAQPAAGGEGKGERKEDVAKNDHDPKGGLHHDAVQRSIFPNHGRVQELVFSGASSTVRVAALEF